MNDPRVEQRFWDKIMPIPESGCWVWTARLNAWGYGHAYAGPNKTVLAHRYFYEKLKGPIPTGLVIDHLCRVRCCVNPNHMEPVTNKENIFRGESLPPINAKKEFCIHGHPLNKKPNKFGRRQCKTCRKAWNAIQHKKRIAKNPRYWVKQ